MDTGERAPGTTGRELARDAIAIVALGAALGVLFNFLQLSSGPRRGLAWIQHASKLASLESVASTIPLAALDSARIASGLRDLEFTAPTTPPPKAAIRGPVGATTGPAAPEKAKAEAAPRPAGAASAPGPGAGASAPAATAAAGPSRSIALPIVPDTREPLEIQYPTIKKLWDAGAAVVVDARPADEYAAGHIAGAVSLPFDDVQRDPELARRLDTQGRAVVITYCDGGTCDLSRNLASALIDAGQKKVLVFAAGLPAWQAAGSPVVTGAHPGEAP